MGDIISFSQFLFYILFLRFFFFFCQRERQREHKQGEWQAKEEVSTETRQRSWLSLFKGPVAGNSNGVLEETARSSGWRA